MTTDELINEITKIRHRNRLLWAFVGYPTRPGQDPVPDIIRDCLTDSYKLKYLKQIAANDREINRILGELLDNAP